MLQIYEKSSQRIKEETEQLQQFIEDEKKRGNTYAGPTEVCPQYIMDRNGNKIDISKLTVLDLYRIIATFSAEDENVKSLMGTTETQTNLKSDSTAQQHYALGAWQTKENADKQFEIKDWKTLSYLVEAKHENSSEKYKQAAKFILDNYSKTMLTKAQNIYEFERDVKGEKISLRQIAKEMAQLEASNQKQKENKQD